MYIVILIVLNELINYKNNLREERSSSLNRICKFINIYQENITKRKEYGQKDQMDRINF